MGIWLARWLIYPAFQKQRDPDRGSSALKAVVAGLSMILIAGPWMSSRGLIRIRGEIVRSAHDPLWYYAAAAFTGVLVSFLAVVAVSHLYRAVWPGRAE